MNIDSIQNGVVIDHITAGRGMRIYTLLGLDELDCSVALIKNAVSSKMGKKDILKIDAEIPISLDVIGYVDPGATVNIIQDGKLIQHAAGVITLLLLRFSRQVFILPVRRKERILPNQPAG